MLGELKFECVYMYVRVVGRDVINGICIPNEEPGDERPLLPR